MHPKEGFGLPSDSSRLYSPLSVCPYVISSGIGRSPLAQSPKQPTEPKFGEGPVLIRPPGVGRVSGKRWNSSDGVNTLPRMWVDLRSINPGAWAGHCFVFCGIVPLIPKTIRAFEENALGIDSPPVIFMLATHRMMKGLFRGIGEDPSC